MKITRPQYLLGNSEEVLQLHDATENFKLIEKCTSLSDYINLGIKLRSQEPLRGYFTEKRFFGIVIGQTFLNYWIIRFGLLRGLTYRTMASKYEDERQSTDTWCDCSHDLVARVSMKTHAKPHKATDLREFANYFAQVAVDNRARIKDPNKPQVIPVVIELSNQPDFKVEQRLRECDGWWIGYPTVNGAIGTDNRAFFKDFARILKSNYNYYIQRRDTARHDAKLKIKARKYDQYDQEDTMIMTKNEKGMFQGTPGWGKTDTSAQGSITPRLSMGPVIYATRVKWLLEQNLESIVSLIDTAKTSDGHPERIVLGSFVDHRMDLKPARAVGGINREDVQQALIEAYEKKMPTIIGTVTYNDYTLKSLLAFCLEKKFPVRLVVDEALEVFPAVKTLKRHSEESVEAATFNKKLELGEIQSLLRKLQEQGLLETLHLYDAVFTSGEWGMDSRELGLPNQPLMSRSSQLAIDTGRTVPLRIVKHEIHEKDIRESIKRYPGVDYDDFVEACANESYYQWCRENDEVPKLITFARGSNSCHFLSSDIRDKYHPDKSAVILASTKQEDRLKIQKELENTKRSTFLANIKISAKGISINNLANVGITPNSELNEEYAVHIPPRSVRRATGERGLPLDQCTKKEGRLHLAYVVQKDGNISKSAKTMLAVIERVRATGIIHTEQTVKYTPPKGSLKKILLEEEDKKYLEKVHSTVGDSDLVGRIEIIEESSLLEDYQKNKEYMGLVESLEHRSSEEIYDHIAKNAQNAR